MVPSQGYISVSRRPPDIEDYIEILRRYRSWIVGPTFAGLVIAVVVAFLWPDTFISTAVMRITPQQVPQSLVPSNISTQLAQRLTAMQQEVQSRTSLSDLILRPSLNLYPKERQRATMEDALEKMRRAIKITLLESSTRSSNRPSASAFEISFSYSDRFKAQSVVSNLVTKFIEQEVNVQRSQSNMTTSFLNDRLKAALDDLNRLDDEVTKFKLANAGRLPEQLQSNLQAVNSLETQLSMANEAISRIAQEKMMLETQLANQKTEAAFISSNLEQNAGSQAVKNERLIQLNRALLDLEGQLSDARQRYREDHPDVRSLEARLAVLKKDRDTFEKDETEAASKSSEPKKGINPQAAQTLESIRQAITPARMRRFRPAIWKWKSACGGRKNCRLNLPSSGRASKPAPSTSSAMRRCSGTTS